MSDKSLLTQLFYFIGGIIRYISSIVTRTRHMDSFIHAICAIPEDDLPDVIARTLLIYDRIGDDGSSEILRPMSNIPKDRRDFIMQEAAKIYMDNEQPLGKARIIEGLSKLKAEDLKEIVELTRQLSFKDTHGSHKLIILETLNKLAKDQRQKLVTLVKPYLKEEDSSITRIYVISFFANLSPANRIKFIHYLPPQLSPENKEKIFYKLDNNSDLTQDKGSDKIISYLDENLQSQKPDENRFLVTVMAAMQKAKLDKY